MLHTGGMLHKKCKAKKLGKKKKKPTGKGQGNNVIKVLVGGHLYWMPLGAGGRKDSFIVFCSSDCATQQSKLSLIWSDFFFLHAFS